MQTNHPEITVIVATYNQESTIARTIDSILEQKCSVPYEILIADDCSTDRTSQICHNYSELYPQLIRHIRRDHNLGLVPNYITSIQEANGRFIADCAGDDFWICPSKLQQQYDILSKNSKISLVHTAWQYFNPSKNTTSPSHTLSGKYSNYFCKETCGKDLIVPIVAHKVKPLIHLCTAMYRRDIVIKAINTYPDLFKSQWLTCEDIQITTVLAASGNIAYLPEITLNYTVTPNTASNQQLPQTAFSFYYGIILLTKLLQKTYSIPSNDLDSFYRSSIQHLAKLMFNTREPKLRYKTKELISLCNTTISTPTKLYLAASTDRVLWNTTWQLKQLVKRLKKWH